MDNDYLSILCDPYSHKPFKSSEDLKSRYKIKKGIIYFQDPAQIRGDDKKFRGFYNLFAGIYDFFIHTYCSLKHASEESFRREYLDPLEVKKGEKVLEVSIGTGGNIHFLPLHGYYYGLDLSIGMLKKCQRNLKKWHRHVDLALGDAEHLPYKNNTFDKVLHMGGFNYFSDKQKAMDEMVRVAKPGAKIIIVDENQKAFSPFDKIPLINIPIKKYAAKAVPPVKFIPKKMKKIVIKDLKNWPAWFISFYK